VIRGTNARWTWPGALSAFFRRPGWRDTLLASGFVVALALPRLAPFPPAHVTWDEMQIALWSEQGGRALREGRWADTVTNAYPAVTLAWLELAPGLDRTRRPSSPEDRDYAFATLPERRRRLALADTVVLLAVLIAAVALVGRPTAVTFGLLLAFDPWLLSQARLYRVEALAADLTLLSLLVALIAAARDSPRLAVASGIVAGTAALTKVSALYLVMIVPVAFAVAGVAARRPGLRSAARLTFAWLLALAATGILLWPALWVSPLAALRVVGEYLVVAASHIPPGWSGGLPADPFFLGRVTQDPGPLFYPVCLAFRLAPLVCVGLLLWSAQLRRRWRDAGTRAKVFADLVLVAFVAGMIVFFSLSRAKAAHYLIPAAPALMLLAAAGLTRAVPPGRTAALWTAAGALALATAAWHHPYYSTSWNLLLGGGRVAEGRLPMGQHEGIATLIERLGRDERAPSLRLASPWTMACYATFPGTCLPQDGGPLLEADYAITHVFRTQRQPWAQLDRWLPDAQRVGEYVRDGVVYATLFRMPAGLRRAELPERDAAGRARPEFGEVFGFRAVRDAEGGAVTLTVFARNGRQPVASTWIDRTLEARDADGRTLERVRLDPGGGFDSLLEIPGAVIPLVARVPVAAAGGMPTLAPGRGREFVFAASP
jgi:hypothetical protein